jgi:beta-glucosidase
MRTALTLLLILVVCIPAFAQGQAPAVTNADAAKRADSYVDRMSPEQKIDCIGGTGFAVRAIPELGLPALKMSDGSFGVRSNERFLSPSYAMGIGLAASISCWDPGWIFIVRP